MKIGKILYSLLIIGGFFVVAALVISCSDKKYKQEYQQQNSSNEYNRQMYEKKRSDEKKQYSNEGRLESLSNICDECEELLSSYHNMDDDASYESIQNIREEIIDLSQQFDKEMSQLRGKVNELAGERYRDAFLMRCDKLEEKMTRIKNEILRDEALDNADPDSPAVYPDAGYYDDDDDYDDYDDDDDDY